MWLSKDLFIFRSSWLGNTGISFGGLRLAKHEMVAIQVILRYRIQRESALNRIKIRVRTVVDVRYVYKITFMMDRQQNSHCKRCRSYQESSIENYVQISLAQQPKEVFFLFVFLLFLLSKPPFNNEKSFICAIQSSVQGVSYSHLRRMVLRLRLSDC